MGDSSNAMSVQFDDGAMVMPYKVFSAIENQVEKLATDPEALDFISLSNIADGPTLAHYYQTDGIGNLSVFASETAASSFKKHFPDAALPGNFFPEVRDFLDRMKEETADAGLAMGPIDVGVGFAERVYTGDSTPPDIKALSSGDQCGVLLQQFMVLALAVQYARGDFTL